MDKFCVSHIDAGYKESLLTSSLSYSRFVSIECMTPEEYKNGGERLVIKYSFAESPFGKVIIASTGKGICSIEFTDDCIAGFNALVQKFPNAKFLHAADELQKNALFIFTKDWSSIKEIKLHLKCTDFQLKVWSELLKIPIGRLVTYRDIAVKINYPKAYRAIGTAVGKNPVACIIPCHRVILFSGELGNYHWGKTRKTAIIHWEATGLYIQNVSDRECVLL